VNRLRDWAPWLALMVVYVVWGSTYLAIRVAVEDLPPLLLAGTRYLIAGLLLYPVSVRINSHAAVEGPRPGRRQWLAAGLVGTMLLAVGNGGVSVAETRISSGLAALVVATVPLWMVLAARVFLSTRVTGSVVAALLVGFGGVAVLADPSGGGPLGGVLIVMVASASWGSGSVLGTRLPLPSRALVGASLEMITGGVVLLIAGTCVGEFGDLRLAHVGWPAILALAYLIGPGSLLALPAYVFALQRLPASTVATYAYVNPIVAVALGALILDESIDGRLAAGGLLVVSAVALSLYGQKRLRRGDPVAPQTHPAGTA